MSTKDMVHVVDLQELAYDARAKGVSYPSVEETMRWKLIAIRINLALVIWQNPPYRGQGLTIQDQPWDHHGVFLNSRVRRRRKWMLARSCSPRNRSSTFIWSIE